MSNISHPEARLKPDLNSIRLLCLPTMGWHEASANTAIAIRNDLTCWWPVEWLDDATVVSVVQSYLRRVKARLPATPAELQVWDHFYRQYRPLVWRNVAVSCRRLPPSADRDDLSQEVWGEIVVQLPKLMYNSARGSLSSWLAGLTRRKVSRLTNVETYGDLVWEGRDELASLQSRHLGPEEACLIGEIWTQWKVALGNLRSQTSAATYEVFWRRFFERQSIKAIAAALKLNPNEVRCRCHRIKKKWLALTRGVAVIDRPFEVLPRPDSHLPREPS